MLKDAANLPDADLLAVPADQPELLYKGTDKDVKGLYRKLSMRFHPDRHPSSTTHESVFKHIKDLYEKALVKMEAGDWDFGSPLRLTSTGGKTYEINYLRRHKFELGYMYVADTVVTYVIDREYADLVQRAEATIRGFHFNGEEMREQIGRCLPAYPFTGSFETDSSLVIVLRKTPDVLLLRDVLEHFGGRLDSRHTAWVISRLLNLCCYMNYAGITHNALSPDTCFISPPHHSVLILGGWWYSAKAGERMIAAPAQTIQWAPHDLMTTKRADIRTDLELVRAIGRELLGDISGVKLSREADAKKAMIDWLRLPASNNPIDEYRVWLNQILQDSFGARRFVELALTSSDIYR